jgi:hypothetical protein
MLGGTRGHRVLIPLVVFLAGACAKATLAPEARSSSPRGVVSPSTSPGASPLEDPGSFEWYDPLSVMGVEVDDPTGLVTFTPVPPPDSVGSIVKIEVNDPEKFPVDLRGVVWVVESDSSVFDVSESSTTMTQEGLEALASCQPTETGCDTTGWSMANIGLATPVLVIDGSRTAPLAQGTSVTWVEGGIQFRVMGPTASLLASDAEEIARAIDGV